MMFDDEKTLQDLPEVPEQEQPQEEPVVEQQEEIKASAANQNNIRELRLRAQRAEQAERERDEAIAYIRSLQQQTQPSAPEEDLSINIGADDYAEGKHLSKIDKKVSKEVAALRKELQQYQQQTAQMTTKARLQAQFNDFDKVVNADNIALLKQMEPEVAALLDQSTDLYNTGVTAYKMIKKLAYVEDGSQVDRAIAQKNSVKPKPLASINPQTGDSPLSRANAFAHGLTDDLKKQLYQEMIEASKNR